MVKKTFMVKKNYGEYLPIQYIYVLFLTFGKVNTILWIFSAAVWSPWRLRPWPHLSPCSRCCWLLFWLKEGACNRFSEIETRCWFQLLAGISVCGSGVGTFIFAPLATWLLEQWVFKRMLLMMRRRMRMRMITNLYFMFILIESKVLLRNSIGCQWVSYPGYLNDIWSHWHKYYLWLYTIMFLVKKTFREHLQCSKSFSGTAGKGQTSFLLDSVFSARWV